MPVNDRKRVVGYYVYIKPHVVDVSTHESSLGPGYEETPHLIELNGYADTEQRAVDTVRDYFAVLRREGLI